MSAKKRYNLNDSSKILSISENILNSDLIQNSDKLISNYEDLFNENEMNQVWDTIHCSNNDHFKSIINIDANVSRTKSLLSPPLFSFKNATDKSKSLIDSLGIQNNKAVKVPRYYAKEHNILSELTLEIHPNFKNILKEILDPFYRFNFKNIISYLESSIFVGDYIKKRDVIINHISIPEDKYVLKYFDSNFLIERLTPKLNVKELITNQLSFSYEELNNLVLEYPIIDYGDRSSQTVDKNFIQNLSFSQGSNISSSSLSDFSQLYLRRFKLYTNLYEENDYSYMISNPNVALFNEDVPKSSCYISQQIRIIIDNLNTILSSLQDNVASSSAQGLEEIYPNKKLNFSPVSFEINDCSLVNLLRQKRELSIELQANIEIDQFSSDGENDTLSETSEVIILDSPSLSPPPKKKFQAQINTHASKLEKIEPKSENINEYSSIELYKSSHKYLVDQNILQNSKLTSLLSSKFNIYIIARYLSTNIYRLGPDLIYDENNCLFITSDIELHQVSIEANVTGQFFGLDKLKKMIHSNLPKFKNIWIVLQLSINSLKLQVSSSNQKLNQLLEEKLNIENNSKKRVRIIYSNSTESSAHLIRLIGEDISDQCDHLTNFTEVPAWNSKSQWLERGWLKPEETTHERFLCNLLWLTPFTAQLILTILDLNQLLNLNQKDLHKKLGKWIPSDVLVSL
ncbi:hypothetical protein CONCODRAFT_5646 [Conidiobolus coronatus NRRL 28638]|uniref:Uncharacterized protein n=1 Tax=Conidiobolus coronatus (strain ATCC 28846 / CBS 209.66 / NRRL 28638) TaxID=796925 RepID=A0A137P9R7_CONC2|nr:hypothetical protein CONCODRAFT_5646 [Conidiobolus coronatus NRRL 28638]|eukprot:KXN71661.1 hypothetical protein CONCODRAFT_5646 [Conidiobolus coronatus NRRL 28638]